jgi:nitric oxide reductase large subunit
MSRSLIGKLVIGIAIVVFAGLFVAQCFGINSDAGPAQSSSSGAVGYLVAHVEGSDLAVLGLILCGLVVLLFRTRRQSTEGTQPSKNRR